MSFDNIDDGTDWKSRKGLAQHTVNQKQEGLNQQNKETTTRHVWV